MNGIIEKSLLHLVSTYIGLFAYSFIAIIRCPQFKTRSIKEKLITIIFISQGTLFYCEWWLLVLSLFGENEENAFILLKLVLIFF